MIETSRILQSRTPGRSAALVLPRPTCQSSASGRCRAACLVRLGHRDRGGTGRSSRRETAGNSPALPRLAEPRSPCRLQTSGSHRTISVGRSRTGASSRSGSSKTIRRFVSGRSLRPGSTPRRERPAKRRRSSGILPARALAARRFRVPGSVRPPIGTGRAIFLGRRP